jgi:UDP-GlcNAc:undecaprenyl-phosphate GlcNAc-1-phosphate transferase
VPRIAGLSIAALLVFGMGALDDCRGLRPKTKLIGQALAVCALYAGGFRLERLELFGWVMPMSLPIEVAVPGLGRGLVIDVASFAMTLAWFVACMNVWNLIDGMDGLASGVGALASGTLMLVAAYERDLGSAALAAALGGGLIGFLLYNWHPACIFLGDSGALLIGMCLGVVGLDLSQRPGGAVPISLPVIVMGLPIADTAMAILRRWVRELPLSAADRRHVHHLLIGLGLTIRQAAFVLYVFTAGLCGIVLLGVAYRSEVLAVGLSIACGLAFLLVLTSRRDELARLVSDYQDRRRRKSQERASTRLAWEAVQRIELCATAEQVAATVCETVRVVAGGERPVHVRMWGEAQIDGGTRVLGRGAVSEPTAFFRLREGSVLDIEVALPSAGGEVVPDIALRALQRVALAAAQRLRRLDPGRDRGASGGWEPWSIEAEPAAAGDLEQGRLTAAH